MAWARTAGRTALALLAVALAPPGAVAAENTGTVRQPLVGGQLVDAGTQEEFGLLTLGSPTGSCSASLLSNTWVVTAAHCVELKGPDGKTIPDPARPGQNMVGSPAGFTLTATWTTMQQQQGVQVETFRPYDVALIRVAAPFSVYGSTTGYQRTVFQDGQFPYWGTLVPVPLRVYGRGISQFATGSGATATKSQRDGLFRVGWAQTSREADNRVWYPSEAGQMIAGGDSGGPSFAWVLGGWALVGVHSEAKITCLPGMACGAWKGPGPAPAGYNDWDWVTTTPEAADAPIEPVWPQIRAMVFPPAPPEPTPIWETTPLAPVGPAAYATWLYALRNDGILVWYRHEGARDGTFNWKGPHKVGEGFQRYLQVLPGGGNVLYAITTEGQLVWLQHPGFNTGAGVNGSGGLIRARVQSGLRHQSYAPGLTPGLHYAATFSDEAKAKIRRFPNGTEGPAPDTAPVGSEGGWKGPFVVGSNSPPGAPAAPSPRPGTPPQAPAGPWASYERVFGGGDGVLYAVTQDGKLLWYHHQQPLAGPLGTLEGPKEIGEGWGGYRQVFSAGRGLIYVVDSQGRLYEYEHLGYQDGSPNWRLFSGGGAINARIGRRGSQYKQVGDGWGSYRQVFSPGVITEGAVPANQIAPVIYTVGWDGKLLWRTHLGYRTGADQWSGPKQVGEGWGGFRQVTALIPVDLPPGGGVR